ncbi:MAG: CerR family C-terminal domain-containing protein [Proteobacteria bacterium]|nr:CerR family C-terminal domain-containing protein [Pseudomonadota bacterium]
MRSKTARRQKPAARRKGKAQSKAPLAGAEDATKEIILAAAQTEFAQRGFGGARARSIASRAAVNTALPFYYFGSKQGLYRAVIVRIVGQLDELIQRTLAKSNDFEPRLDAFVEGVSGYLADNPEWMQLMVRELLETDSQLLGLAQAYLKPLVEIGAREISLHMDTGKVRKLDPLQALASIGGEVFFYFLIVPLLEVVGITKPLSGANLALHRDVTLAILKHGLVGSS